MTRVSRFIGKAAFRFVDLGSVLVPHPVEKIHVAVLTALAALDAAVPWIPDVVQKAHLLSVPIIIIAARTGNKSTPCTAPPDVIGLTTTMYSYNDSHWGIVIGQG